MNKTNKVTAENITRLAEDYLYDVLNSLPESHPTFILVDAELDRRSEIHNRTLKIQQDLELQRLAELHQIESDIKDLFDGFRGKKTLFLIERLGQEFMDDYSICPITFTVTSYVAYKIQHHGTWDHATIEAANCKLATLLYDRIYGHYMRDASPGTLVYLQKALFGGSNV